LDLVNLARSIHQTTGTRFILRPDKQFASNHRVALLDILKYPPNVQGGYSISRERSAWFAIFNHKRATNTP
jgi:hypothetical protein